MRQKRFETDYLRNLKAKVGENMYNYRLDEFEINSEELVDVPEVDIAPDLLDKLLQDPSDDFYCSKLVYENIKGMNPLLASQETFLAYLTHTVFHEYVKQRWNGIYSETDISETFIKKHWFGTKQNAIGRLWWNVYLTINENNKIDPYEYTKVLYRQSDITQNLSSSEVLFPNRKAIHAILGFYRDHDEIFEPRAATNPRNRFITKSLNRWGGVKNLSYFEAEDFINEMSNNLPTILSIKASDKHNDFEWIQS